MGACMSRSWPGRFTYALLTGLSVLAAAGCRSAPWWAKPQAHTSVVQHSQPLQPASAAQSTQNALPGSHEAGAPAGSDLVQSAKETPGLPSVEELVDQISQSEKLDPAARQRLEADLRQTDPALWPAMVQSFRAALAYRRQREGRLREREPAEHLAATAAAPTRTPATTADATGNAAAAPPEGESTRHWPASPAIGDPATRLAGNSPAGDQPQVPPAENGAKGAGAQAQGPSATPPASGSAESTGPPQRAGKKATPSQGASVELAGYAEGSAEWQKHLAAAAASLEAELREAAASPDLADKHARLRLLALVAGQREEALRPIPGVPPAVQDFWRQELYGLAVWLDSQRQDDATRRAGEARQQLANALVPLGWVAPLVLRNLAFITQVHSYGDYKPFARYEFTPEQEVLLYVEIENFASEETPKGFHTVLEASYRIFDNRNQQVAEKQLGTTEEFCRNPRRDFFVVYHLRLPKRIYNGRHTLQLTVVDQKSKKVGQASIEFTIQEPNS